MKAATPGGRSPVRPAGDPTEGFELRYLARLTQAGLKPLSRWEGAFDDTTRDTLRQLGLATRIVRRRVQNGRPAAELIFSRLPRALDVYTARFDRTPIRQEAAAARFEGRLFGYPSCCVESYVSRGYAANGVRRSHQRILFHWACSGCAITPVLLPRYREIHAQCRREWRHQPAAIARPGRALLRVARPVTAVALAAVLNLLEGSPAGAGSPPNPHQVALPECEDPDADGLTTDEEVLLGMNPFNPDEDGNGRPDGVDLARACATAIDRLLEGPSNTNACVTHHPTFGLENCDVCGESLNMGFIEIVHPLENHSISIPYVAKHYLDHGSFTYRGTVHGGRVNPVLLNLLLTTDGLGHFIGEPTDWDADNDGLRDWEEGVFDCDPARRDTDGNQLLDGIQTARALEGRVRELPRPRPSEAPPKDRPYAIVLEMDGHEICPRCGERVVMEDWTAVHPVTGLSVRFSSLGLHYLRHGAFSWEGGHQGAGRVDPRQLHAVLTGIGNGHPIPARPDNDGDFLSDREEADLRMNPAHPDEDGNGVPD